ncbi:MAG: hypothetical protein WA908_03300 [Pontixanthobacter sp.]
MLTITILSMMAPLNLSGHPTPHANMRAEPEAVRSEQVAAQSDALSIEQIDTTAERTQAAQIDLPGKDAARGGNIAQLPGDIEAIDPADPAAEQIISRPVESPEARLYAQVAEVWETIRSRGQQPTPELIAREIGPDSLTTFLDQNPGAEGMFGEDSDELPLDGPDLDFLGSDAVFLPPADGQ